MDTLLLSTLITLRSGREWKSGKLPNEVINNVRAVVNHPFGAELSSDDISARVQQLRGRYLLFKKVVGTHGVQWNMLDRVVAAEDSTWKIIIEVCETKVH